MQLTTANADALRALAQQLGCDHRRFPAGSVLQTSGSSPEVLLVVEGHCRLLDPDRWFGSHTVLRPESPYLCGALTLLNSDLGEELMASTDCEAIVLGTLPLDPKLEAAVLDHLRSGLSPSELPLIQKYIQGYGINVPADQQTPEIYLRRWQLLPTGNPPPESHLKGPLIYADRSKKGFHYGQLITAEALRCFLGDDNPRVLIWSDAEQLTKQHSRHAIKPQPLDRGEAPASRPLQTGALDEHQPSLTQQVRQLGFRPVGGGTAAECHTAVLTMLAQFYGLPMRRDNLRKAGHFLAASEQNLSLEKLVSVVDQFGLAGRIVAFRSGDASRIPTPAVILDPQGNPSLIVEANGSGLLILNPSTKIKRLNSDALSQQYGLDLTAVTISAGRHTPQQRFGLSWVLPFLSRYKVGLVEVLISSFLAQLFALATPLLFQQIIDRVIGQGSVNALGGFAVVMVLLMVLELIFGNLRTFQFMEISNRVDISLGSAIISRLLRLNIRYFEKHPVGELASRLNELDKIRSFLTGTALTVVLDALFAMLYFGVMFFYSPILAGIILGSIPLLLLVILGLTPITQRLIRQRAEAYSRTQSYMVEVLNGIQTVKVQNSELSTRRNWEDRHLDGINKGFRSVLANTASSNALQLINKSSNILVITVGAWLVLDNQLTLGGLIAFRIISGYVTQPILRLAGTWQNFQEVSLAVERLGDVVNQPLETEDIEDTNISMPPIEGTIRFDQVSFSYGATSSAQLSGVSLTIPKGSFTGLVGQSGCGKSTLLKLIPRLYEPSRGKVLIDDLDVSKVELYSLRRQLGFIPQDCLLFEGSIYSNIAVADPEAATDQVVEAARLACAHDFIMGLPYGYSTPVGEKGAGLSGGQRQRIALARMLLQNPNLMILDEATSALDVDTEQQVVRNLRSHAKGRTLLMITHRLSTLIHADQIVLMHNSRIDSVGSHDELMAQSGRYYALYQQQFGG